MIGQITVEEDEFSDISWSIMQAIFRLNREISDAVFNGREEEALYKAEQFYRLKRFQKRLHTEWMSQLTDYYGD